MSRLVMGIACMITAALLFAFRSKIATFFAWWHREGPVGGGAMYELRSTPRSVGVTSICIFLAGLFLILKTLGLLDFVLLGSE